MGYRPRSEICLKQRVARREDPRNIGNGGGALRLRPAVGIATYESTLYFLNQPTI
jgi:hypothetical protein